LEGRALAQGRLDPDASAVHLNDLLGDGKPEASVAFGLGVGTINLMELLEYAGLVLSAIPGPVSVTLTLQWPLTALAVTRTSPVSVNLMALPTRSSGGPCAGAFIRSGQYGIWLRCTSVTDALTAYRPAGAFNLQFDFVGCEWRSCC
jgi:hypothetical protein